MSAARDLLAPSKNVPHQIVASPSQAPSGVRRRPHGHPVDPDTCATGRHGTTRDAPGRARASDSSRSSCSSGSGLHTTWRTVDAPPYSRRAPWP